MESKEKSVLLKFSACLSIFLATVSLIAAFMIATNTTNDSISAGDLINSLKSFDITKIISDNDVDVLFLFISITLTESFTFFAKEHFVSHRQKTNFKKIVGEWERLNTKESKIQTELDSSTNKIIDSVSRLEISEREKSELIEQFSTELKEILKNHSSPIDKNKN